jgi:hypothetical protein
MFFYHGMWGIATIVSLSKCNSFPIMDCFRPCRVATMREVKDVEKGVRDCWEHLLDLNEKLEGKVGGVENMVIQLKSKTKLERQIENVKYDKNIFLWR